MNIKSVLWIIPKILSFRTYLSFFMLLSIYNSVLHAQWVQTNGPGGGDIYCLAANGPNIFAGTENGVFHSTDNGTIWEHPDNGLTGFAVHSLIISGSNVFAGTSYGGIFFSTDNGTNWTQVNNGLDY